ncbi:SDR family oxidoreductase [Pseudokineococcus basanitobsidens]|uniref:SDR family oxidoreductase n=1 Tax=Pseudokineococcus basanitobsidens TaxID=1926649 RepID=A0ABU8RKK8_9ACTN
MSSLARLRGRTALVTGATSGIGRATALRLAAEGAHVAVGGRDARCGEAVVAEIIGAGGRAVFLPVDLDGTEAVSHDVAARAEAALGGRVDVLVNNAAVVSVSSTPETTEAQLAEAWAVNVTGPFFLVARLAPAMAARGGGAVVGISSWMAQGGTPVVPAYSASKAAADALVRNWATEFGPTGVRVNSVSPGVVRPVDDRSDPGWPSVAGTPLGRFVRPEQVAAAVAYLASDDAAGVHGTRLDVDGSRTSTAVIAG